MKRWSITAAVVLAMVVGFAWWSGAKKDAPGGAPGESAQGRATGERQVLYWYDPMRPDVHFDEPGKSPFMDMQLVAKYADEEASAEGIVSIDPRMAQNLGVRTAPVERRGMNMRTRSVGSVTIDETRRYAIEARASGWIEKLDVRAVGDAVKRGQRVAGIYSPELYAAQAELVLAAQGDDATLKMAARQRLLLLGLPEQQVDQVLQAGRPQRQASVVSPSDGVVTELNVREGQQTTEGMPLMRVADLSRVWIVVDVPEAQLAGLRPGEPAEARLRALPGRIFEGEVAHVYPELQAETRTVRARVVLDNPRGELRPGMFAEVTLGESAAEESAALVIPTEALIRTGTRTVVIVAEAAGRYRPVAVEPGPEAGNETVIVSGLEPGQQVVVSGQFLLDSEASLRGAFDRLEGKPSGQEPDR